MELKANAVLLTPELSCGSRLEYNWRDELRLSISSCPTYCQYYQRQAQYDRTWQKNEYITRWLVCMNLEEGSEGRIDVVRLTSGGVVNCYGVLTTLYVQNLRTRQGPASETAEFDKDEDISLVVERAELFRIKGRAHDHYFQGTQSGRRTFSFAIRRRVAFLLYRLQVGHKDVSPERPFVGLVDNDDTVPRKEGIR